MNEKSDKQQGHEKTGKAADRQARMAQALRANLKKRKAQGQRARDPKEDGKAD